MLDWMNQAYLRMYLDRETADKLLPFGIRGATDVAALSQAPGIDDQDWEALIEVIGGIVPNGTIGFRGLANKFASDPKVKLLAFAWGEFGAG